MGVMAYSLLWVMQDLYHQPYTCWKNAHVQTHCVGKLGLHSVLFCNPGKRALSLRAVGQQPFNKNPDPKPHTPLENLAYP